MRARAHTTPWQRLVRAVRPRRRRSAPAGAALIGRDLARIDLGRGERRPWLPVLVGALLAALCLAALRVDLIRQRYELAAAMRTEKELLEERRLLTAEVRRLRDPGRLAELAAARGFVRPQVVTLLGAHDASAGGRP